MPSTERILAFGPPNTGKTYQLLKLAEWLEPTGAQFYIADTDDSYERSIEEDGFAHLTNIHPTFIYDWEDYVEWAEEVIGTAKQGIDWLVVDRADKAWARVQDWYMHEVYGKSRSKRLIEKRKSMTDRKGDIKPAMVVSGNDQADWQVVNSEYSSWFMPLIYKSRANIYLTTSAGSVRSEDSGPTKEMFSAIGSKPDGQKGMAHEVHTVFHFHQDRKGNRLITTAKDRGREYFDKDNLVSLPVQYLAAKAGWTRK